MHMISQQDVFHICFTSAFLFPFRMCSFRDPLIGHRSLRSSNELYKSYSPQTTHIYTHRV